MHNEADSNEIYELHKNKIGQINPMLSDPKKEKERLKKEKEKENEPEEPESPERDNLRNIELAQKQQAFNAEYRKF